MNNNLFFIKLLIVTLICLLMFSCKKEHVSLEFLNPNKELTSDQLINMKFDLVREDIPMYKTMNGDTTIVFTLTHDSINVINQSWEIEFYNLDSLDFKSFLSDYNSVIFSEFIFNRLGVENLTIYNYKRNMIFTGTIERKINNRFLLKMDYYFPY